MSPLDTHIERRTVLKGFLIAGPTLAIAARLGQGGDRQQHERCKREAKTHHRSGPAFSGTVTLGSSNWKRELATNLSPRTSPLNGSIIF